MKTKLRRFLYWFIGGLVVAFVLLLLPFNPPKWTASEISQRVDLMNEKAAIDTPHHTLGKKTREVNLALFEKVERGEALSEEESAKYRVLYQSILNEKQHELSLLDDQLTVLTNYKLDEKNNVGSMGIEGSHDHHDASAGANMVALWEDLAKLDQAEGAMASYSRVRAALAAYKDLDDIVLHMATRAADQIGTTRASKDCRRATGGVRADDASLQKRAVRSRELTGLHRRGSPGAGSLHRAGRAGAGPRLRQAGARRAKPRGAMGHVAVAGAAAAWRHHEPDSPGESGILDRAQLRFWRELSFRLCDLDSEDPRSSDRWCC
jgi:hypothetical protein